MNPIKALAGIEKRKKLKKKKVDEWEYDPDSDYPVHEKYTKEEPWKEA